MDKSVTEEIPQKKVFSDLWMNLHQKPPQQGRQLEAAEDGTLMGRLASRMSSRDMIDELDLGPTGRSPEAKKAQVADAGMPTKMHVEGPAMKTGIKIEKEHKGTVDKLKANPSMDYDEAYRSIASEHLMEHTKYYDKKEGLPAMEKKLKKKETADSLENTISSKMMMGAGMHQQTADLKASNMSDSKPDKGVREGSNMADQAKAAGNVWNTMEDPVTDSQKSLKKA